MTYITVGSSNKLILDFLGEFDLASLEEVTADVIPQATKVFVNGKWVGLHLHPEDLVSTIRQLRRSVSIPVEVGVVYDTRDRELRLYSDAGRCCRPLFIVEEQKLKIKKHHIRGLQDKTMSWSDLMTHGVVEFIDTNEEESLMIAMNYEDINPDNEYSSMWTRQTHSNSDLCRWTHATTHDSEDNLCSHHFAVAAAANALLPPAPPQTARSTPR